MLTPRHIIELTDTDVEQIREGLKAIGKHGLRSPLGAKLDRLPSLTTEDGSAYTERGEQAVRRMLSEGPHGLLISTNPHAEELRTALRRDRLADARLEVSLREGKPGKQRDAAVDESTTARDELRTLAVAYALAYQEED